MYAHQSSGIILKQFHSPYKVALIDSEIGRIDGISLKPLCVGASIGYAISRQTASHIFITNISLSYLPFSLARSDLLFWHHVLELCYYFVPIGNHVHHLFQLLQFLYTVDNAVHWSMSAKKLFLLKLLSIIGWNVELSPKKSAQINTLTMIPLSDVMHMMLDCQDEKTIDEWLQRVVAEHPALAKFKTLDFLVINRRT